MRFGLTVDNIMRGPDVVGYPPSGMRWSDDSQQLYFAWRKPGETDEFRRILRLFDDNPRLKAGKATN